VADDYVDATFYAQVAPEWSRYPVWGERQVNGAKVTRITQSRPDKPVGGTVLVKLTIRVPKAAFMPLRPEAIVVVPESLTEPQPVEVVAVDPRQQDG
jgi:hypothetical protein